MFPILLEFFFLIIVFLLKSNSCQENVVVLNQYEYELNIFKYNLTIINLNKELYNMKYSLLVYINHAEFKVDNIFKYYTNYYNHYWLFFITDINIFNNIISKYESINEYMIIYGIIIPKKLKNKLPRKINKLSPSIFYIEDNYTNFLEESDFRKNDKIIYYSFDTEKPISRYPEIYFLITSLSIFSISCFILMSWNIAYRTTKYNYITPIQKYCNILPYLNLILSIFLLIKCINIKGKDPYLHYEYMSSIDTIYIFMNSITKITIWNFLTIISTGWKIAIQTLSRKIYIFYIKMIAFLFFMTFIDISIYNINEKAYNIISEIKNIIFYLIITIIILKEMRKTMKLLLKKLYYAETLIPQFSEGLIFKIKIFKQLRVIIVIYPIIFIITFIIHKIIPENFDSTCLKFVDYYFNDIILVIYLLIVFSPKALPENYDVDFAKDLEDDSGEIYKLIININYDGSIIFNQLDKKETFKKKHKKISIIIFGPNSSEINNLTFNKYNCLINNDDEERDSNKLFNSLELGFLE